MRVIAYHTDDPIYHKAAECLRRSLVARNIPHHIRQYPSMGWVEATCQKPRFIRDCLKSLSDDVLVYTDADSCLMHADLEAALHAEMPAEADVGFVKAPWGEILSGTIVFRRNQGSLDFMENWLGALSNNPLNVKIPDQAPFSALLRNKKSTIKSHCLSPKWCKIFDLMRAIENPVFVHYQASRVYKNRQNDKAVKSFFQRLGK